jgi:putative nucleotidyltransferase with HDIG domain
MGYEGAEPQKIEQVLAQLEGLPLLAPVVARILALTEDSKSSSKQLIELVGSDPSLTLRVLSLVRRAEHGVRPETATLQSAVVLLGFTAIRQATLALKVMEVFGGGVEEEQDLAGFSRREFWKHCLAVACAARRIALSAGAPMDAEEAFVLGLLHDVGKIALNTVMPKSFARIARRADQTGADIAEVERTVLGMDHTVVGRRLAERWDLPQPLIDAIWLHHQPPGGLPPSVAKNKHVEIVQLADTLAREQRIGYSGNHRFLSSSRELAQGIDLPEAQRLAIVESLAEQIESRAAWIGADDITSREIYVRALVQAGDESAAANIALTEKNRLLEREAEYFRALGWLNEHLSPRASVREVCAVGAEALRQALSTPSVLVFVTSAESRWVETGLSDGRLGSWIVEQAGGGAETREDVESALRLAEAGTWIGPPGRGFDEIVGRYQSRLGGCNRWLLPIVQSRRWVGGAVFSATDAVAASLRAEGVQLAAISAAVGSAVSQAQARTAAVALSDELAEINRRTAAMQAELVQARALRTVAAMAMGAAHELNNPLAVISGRAQMLRQRVNDEETRRLLETIEIQARSCSDIVTELMQFADPRPPQPESISLPAFLEELRVNLSSSGLLDGRALIVEASSDTPAINFDREQLNGVFRELIRNAIEATEASSGRLTIKAATDLAEEIVVVELTDNGRGMTTEILVQATDPFFSHRPAGRGRGMGLARTQRWLQQNGATMRIRSEVGQGATVELRFPVAASAKRA